MRSRASLASAMIAIAALSASAWAQAPTGRASLGTVREAFPTGDPRTSVYLIEREAPSDVRVGAEFEYILRITNLTQSPLNNVSITEQAGEGLDVKLAGPEGFRQGGGGFTWELATLPPRAQHVMRFRASPTRTGEITNCCNVTFTTRSCGSIRVVEPQLTIEKFMPPEVVICDPIPVRIVVTNPGSGTADNVIVRDMLPDGLTAENGQKAVESNLGSLGPGQSREFSFRAKATAAGSFRNCATVEGGGNLRAEACAETRVTQPRLELTKTGRSEQYLGRPSTFDITVRNTGDAVARDVTVTDTIPAGLRPLRATQGGRVSGNQLVWSLGALDPGASRTLQVECIADQAGSFRNVASARGYCCEAAGEAPLVVRGIPAVLLEVIDENDPDEVGTDEEYTITVTNQGTAPATNIRIICEVQAEANYLSSRADGGLQAAVAGQTVTFQPLPSLAPRAQARFYVTIRGNREGDTRFKVTMYTNETGERPIEETEATRFY